MDCVVDGLMRSMVVCFRGSWERVRLTADG
jgi:hypothetical protein